MIKAIVQKHTFTGTGPAKTPRTWGADYIENKGDGQVFLLHGGPGVGKTFVRDTFPSKRHENVANFRIDCRHVIVSTLLGRWNVILTSDVRVYL